MLKDNLVIGLCSNAQCGKDTFFKIFNKIIPNSSRFALADRLKHDIRLDILNLYHVDIFNCTTKEKELVRQEMVDYGKVWRQKTNGRHWIDLLKPEILEYHKNNPTGIAIICDIRYNEYENDEVDFVKKEMGGVLLHIQRYTENTTSKPFVSFTDKSASVSKKTTKTFILAANKEEEINEPKLQKAADYRISWPTALNPETNEVDYSKIEIYVEEFVKFLKR